MPNVDELLLLTYDEIDFTNIDNGSLYHLERQTQDPFIATSALGELSQRDTPQTRAAATAILESPWDQHLAAYATTILYGIDKDESIRRMSAMIDRCPDPKVLGAMVENVLSDRERFERDDVRWLLHRLVTSVKNMAADAFSDMEERAEFLALYDRADATSRN